jgi:signal transduction histidine kinase
MQSPGSSPWHSLERKLPLLIGGVVALLLLTALGIAQFEVRHSAVAATDQRLQRIAAQLGEWVENALATRERVGAGVAADPALVAFLEGSSDDHAAVAAVLDRLRVRADSGLRIELRDAAGNLMLSTGATDALSWELRHTAEVVAVADSTVYTPLFTVGGTGRYRATIPVHSGRRIVGHIHQERRVGSRLLAEQIEPLLGRNIDIYITNRDGGPWIALDERVLTGVAAVPATGITFERDHAGIRHFALAHDLGVGGWLLIVETPLSSALASTRRVARRVVASGVVLLLLGGLAAWFVSRSVTAPLRRLGHAADAIAAGDYSRRTGVDRSDEIGLLARGFDAMAGHVEATHAELEHRFDEARTLAAELRHANTRLQNSVQETDAARSEAQQANRAKSEFLATISHEIRTPINAVIGYTDLMELGLAGELTEQQRDYVQRIRRSGEHLTALVNDVLDFAKIESGQMRAAREVRSAPATIHAAVTMLQGRATGRSIEIRTDCAVQAVYLGDQQRVQQILLNLLANAIKFTPDGGTIGISCDRRSSCAHPPGGEDGDRHEWTCVTVTDTGAGIAADQVERIFEPFVQGQPVYTRPHGGAGLGLAISRSLARIMGGDITVESAPGHGATFTLWLPHPAGAAVAQRGAPAARSAETRNTRRR